MGGKGGSRGGGGSASAETSLTREQAAIAREIFERTRGLRGGLIGAAERRLGLPLTQGRTTQVQVGVGRRGRPIFEDRFISDPEAEGALFGPRAPEREALELGFTGAREDILSRVPVRGGQLNRVLSDIEVDRARSIGALEAEATREATDIATGAAFEAPRVALGGLGGAAAGFGRAANREFEQQQVKNAQLGSAGAAIGGLVKKCWIALGLYGNGMRFRLARSWIFDHWQGRTAGIVRKTYLVCGATVAWFVKRSPLCSRLIKPFFDLAVKKELELLRNG